MQMQLQALAQLTRLHTHMHTGEVGLKRQQAALAVLAHHTRHRRPLYHPMPLVRCHALPHLASSTACVAEH